MTPLKLQTVPARRGATWVRQGFRVFFRQPMAYAGLFALVLFGMFIVPLVPLIGSALWLMLLPLISLVFMVATRLAQEGRTSMPAAVATALRMDRPRAIAMLQLGLAYAAAAFAVMTLSDLLDGGAFNSFMASLPKMQNAPETVNSQFADPRVGLGLLVLSTLLSLLSVPFWHAPALVLWGGQGVAQALFSSTLACWRNKGAFTVYGLTWVAASLLFVVIGGLVFGLLGLAQVFMLTAIPLTLLLATVFYASLYFTFADCFLGAPGDDVPTPEPTP